MTHFAKNENLRPPALRAKLGSRNDVVEIIGTRSEIVSKSSGTGFTKQVLSREPPDFDRDPVRSDAIIRTGDVLQTEFYRKVKRPGRSRAVLIYMEFALTFVRASATKFRFPNSTYIQAFPV